MSPEERRRRILASKQRYNKSPAGLAAKKRYRLSAKGKATRERFFQRRPNYVAEWSRTRSANQEGESWKRWKATLERYRANPETKAKMREYGRRYRERNREKLRAGDSVHYALEKGKLVRLPCEVCGNPKSQAHHDDYSKRLEVRWLCARHHKWLHKGLLKQESGERGEKNA